MQLNVRSIARVFCMAIAVSHVALRAEPPTLKPAETVVLYNETVPESKSLALYYAEKRGIPVVNVIGVSVENTEDIERVRYEEVFITGLRNKLHEVGIEESVRAIATMYGIPLRIGAVKESQEVKEYIWYVRKRIEENKRKLCDIISELRRLGAPGMPLEIYTLPDRKDMPPSRALPIDMQLLMRDLADSYHAAEKRLGEMPDGKEKEMLGGQLLALGTQATGLKHLMQPGALPTGEDPADVLSRQTTETALQRFKVIDARITSLSFRPASPDRSRLMSDLYFMNSGVMGELRVLATEEQSWTGPETAAALDSELSLIYWEPYLLGKWLDNPLFAAHDRRIACRMKLYRTLMISRLDAQTPQIVKRMIDDAVATENQGLTGTLYVDARGLDAGALNGMGVMDVHLRDLAKIAGEKTSMKVVVDDTPALFAPGKCPMAALYCGWYSLEKYQPAFQWQPGSVGFHVASFEAKSLHDPASQGWCKRMLEDGVCATIGPVAEPYLVSFPRPDLFFTMLLTGKFTLAECFWRTSPFASWNQILIGDPLYNPFCKFPAMKTEDLQPGIYPPDNWGTWPYGEPYR
ncbi:MAG TPA: TIGR03790 family protein [Candidatus Brocadiia bacterium]|nr:TIGR03790 family protein [Candidatus Brocadiia bacterium]